jgi:glutathione synthase/RimK-type ligase-like ATP-grasp enzyme
MMAATAADLSAGARNETLASAGFTYPFLLRAPGFYAGRHFVFIADETALEAALQKMQKEEYIVIEYIDTRDASGMYRKFRTLFIDGELYPLHLALSDRWKVHYFSANMDTSAEYRAIEARFLSDQAAFLGPTATAALDAVAQLLGLEYAGADFGLDGAGNVVIFEANAGMTLVRPDADPKWDYRRAAADDAALAVTAMLRRYVIAD